MPTRFLSDAERGAFSSWPDVARSDLVAYFSLDPDDIRWVRSLRYPANQIASAVQLAALPYLGFVPDPLNAPVAVVEYVSERIGVPAGALGGYTTTSDRVCQQHRTAVIERLGWSLCGRGEWKLLGDWLVARALEHDALSVLFRQALTRGCAKTWVLAVLVLGVGSCYKESSGCVVVVVGEAVGDSS